MMRRTAVVTLGLLSVVLPARAGEIVEFKGAVLVRQEERAMMVFKVKNGEIKALLADLLGLDEVRAQGALAAETAKLLKQGLHVVRQEQAARAEDLRALYLDIAGLGDVPTRVGTTLGAQDDFLGHVGRIEPERVGLRRVPRAILSAKCKILPRSRGH